MALPPHRRGFTLTELAISLALIVALLTILLPALSSARVTARRATCTSNQRQLGEAWLLYLDEHENRFPSVPDQPAWRYGGVRFSAVDDSPFLDYQRPLTPYVPVSRLSVPGEDLFRCPADQGIAGHMPEAGTSGRTAFRSFGTSYRANAALVDARLANLRGTPVGEPRGVTRSEITTPPSRMVIMGDPLWYEVLEGTGREADWHGQADACNMLFLDGSVRFNTVRPRRTAGPVVFDPVLRGSVAPPVEDHD